MDAVQSSVSLMDAVHTTCLLHPAVVSCCCILLHPAMVSCCILLLHPACLPWCVQQLASSGVCTEWIEFMDPNGYDSFICVTRVDGA